MYRGRHQVGEEVALAVLCKGATGVPVDPDACPKMDVYGPTGKRVSGKPIPILDPGGSTGLFQGKVYLDESYSVGAYSVVYRWDAGGTQGEAWDAFEICAGGGASGQVISLFNYERPQANHLVQQRTSGRLYKGKNPRS